MDEEPKKAAHVKVRAGEGKGACVKDGDRWSAVKRGSAAGCAKIRRLHPISACTRRSSALEEPWDCSGGLNATSQ